MPKYRQFILRLNPSNPQDAALIDRLDKARATWGGVQQFLKNAALEALNNNDDGGGVRIDIPSSDIPPSQGLINALRRVMPDASENALIAMASSAPLANVRTLYGVLEAFLPASLTETEAKLLQAFCEDIGNLLQTAAQERLPIRQTIQGDER